MVTIFHLTVTIGTLYNNNHCNWQVNCYLIVTIDTISCDCDVSRMSAADTIGSTPVVSFCLSETRSMRCAMRDYILTQAQSAGKTFTFPALHRIVENWRKRRQLRQLEQLDDHVLMDIGLTRDELIRVQRIPLAVDPVT